MKKPKQIPSGALITLKHLPHRSAERKKYVLKYAERYGVSVSTIYRALRSVEKVRSFNRKDRGKPRVIALMRFVRMVAYLKDQAKEEGRHLSTEGAVKLLEAGLEINGKFVQAPKGRFKRTTINKYLKAIGPKKFFSKKPVEALKKTETVVINPGKSPCKTCVHSARSKKECINIHKCTLPQEYAQLIVDDTVPCYADPDTVTLKGG